MSRTSLQRLGRWRRNVELLLVAGALLLAWLGLFSVETAMGVAGSLPIQQSMAIVAAALVGHLFIRWWAPVSDPFMYPLALLLNLLGLLMIHRLDLTQRQRVAVGDVFKPVAAAQVLWLLLGLALMTAVLVLLRDHRQLQRYTYTSMVAGLLLILSPMLPVVGATLNGARLWIRVGGLSFQPAEAAKVLLAVFFAGYLARHRHSMSAIQSRWLGIGLPRPRELGPLIAAWGLSLLVLISQRDLGTSLLFFGLFVGLLYIATGQRTWLVLGALLFGGGASVAYALFSHVQDRVQVWLDPFAHELTSGYQLVQGIYGLASGGLFGRGLGRGFSWLVPYAQSDFILTAFGEELGYVGLTAVVLLYALLIERMLRTALAGRDEFGKLLAAGLALVLALQVFVVLGGVSRFIPLTGLTTPFLAAGGSALVINWIMVGLVLRISDTNTRLNLPGGEGV